MSRQPATPRDSSPGSPRASKAAAPGAAPARETRRTWVYLGVGAVCFLLLFLIIGIKLRSWLSRSGTLDPVDGRAFLIVNKNSGRCLSVASGSPEAGARIVQGPMPESARSSERWILIGVSKGVFRLRNENSQRMLEIPSANTDHGVQAIQWYDGFTLPHQHWQFERVGDSYLLRVLHSQQVLGIALGAKEEGAPAVQWEFTANVPDQLWTLRTTNP